MAANKLKARKVEDHEEDPLMTVHAKARMGQRSVSTPAIEAAMDFGREVHTRGATINAIGRREVRDAAAQGEDLGVFEGVQVVCSRDGAVITIYRNRDLSGLRRGENHFRRRRAA